MLKQETSSADYESNVLITTQRLIYKSTAAGYTNARRVTLSQRIQTRVKDLFIGINRLYYTHPNEPRKLLTARKRVGPIPARRLVWRRVSHHLSDRYSSPDSSSSSSPSDHSLSGNAPPDTTNADTSAPLSTPYPPTTSESSLGLSSERSLDSSSLSSRPSRKRCRSPIASVPSPTHDSRNIAPTPADLLPPRKRFRDSYSSEDSGEEHMEVDTADADLGISDGVVAHTEDSIGGIPDLEDTIYDIVHYMSEVRIDRITEIETTQRQLETSQLVASGERASLVERIRSLRLEYLKEEFRQVRRDHDDIRRRLRRLESYVKRHLGFHP
ncbi:hypothetical protein Tco_0257423 [Tanacetum coccineum]